jgi:hypothetical protein
MTNNRVIIGIWCLVSFTISGFFIYHSIVLFGQDPIVPMHLFYASAVLAYGLYSAALLLTAIYRPNRKQERFIKYGIVIMLIAQAVFGVLNRDFFSPWILLGLLISAFILIANWLSVKYVLDSKIRA